MRKSDALTFIAIVLIAATLLGIPALAVGLEYTRTILYFNVAALDEVTVTLVTKAPVRPQLVEVGQIRPLL